MGQDGFFSLVYSIVARIPPGSVATYGQIALMAGKPRGARVVGYAMRSAPQAQGLPCHRVVNRFGEMAPEYAFGGAHLQRQRLESEGVTFLPSGCVDLKRYLWRP